MGRQVKKRHLRYRFTSVKSAVRVRPRPYMAPWCKNQGVFRLYGSYKMPWQSKLSSSDRTDRNNSFKTLNNPSHLLRQKTWNCGHTVAFLNRAYG